MSFEPEPGVSSRHIEHLRDNLDRIVLGDREIFLVGTAHVSESSAELVEAVIREQRPDTVAVELCASRHESLKDPDRWKNTDIVSVIRSGKAYVLLAQLLLVGFQKKLGSKLNVKPGAEMMRAMAVADEIGAKTELVDRDVKTTLKRSWGSLNPWTMAQLLVTLLGGLFGHESVSEAEIERLKSSDALEEALREFGEVLPTVRTALIDERDQYLAAKIANAPGKRIVAVVGAGHVPGICRIIGTPIDIAQLETLPKRGWIGLLFSWGLPVLIGGLILWALFSSGVGASAELLSSWALVVALFGAFGAMIALAHPLTILAAFFAAPLTPFNPIIKAGRVAALTEALLRKPRVADFEMIADDISTYRGIFRNRICRILLVLVSTTLLNWAGIFWGTKLIASSLVSQP